MGGLVSRLTGKKRIHFFQGKDYLTAVSEGEEVVWTNFEATDPSFKYDGLGLDELPPTAAARANNATQERKRTNGKEVRRPSATPKQSTADSHATTSTGAVVDIKVDATSRGRTSSSASTVARRTSPAVTEKTTAPTVVVSADGYRRKSVFARESTGVVQVSKPALPPPTDDTRELSIISLNMLADYNLTNSIANAEDGRYKHAVDSASWSVRLLKFQQLFEFQSKTTDVFALQEVDFTKFRQDLLPMMSKLGFTGCHQWDEDFAKKGEPNHPFGVATFYKSNKFRESFKEARSRSLILGLSYTYRTVEEDEEEEDRKKQKKNKKPKKGGVSDWYVVNVHLEADPKKNEKRLGQLSSALFNLSVHTRINPTTARVVVLGDFNSLREEPPFQWLLAGTEAAGKERPEASVAPVGTYATDATLVEENGKNEKLAHAFRFADAYGSSSIDPVTRDAATYADPYSNGRVDHLLYTADTSTVVSVLHIPQLTQETKKFGVFGKDYPSDHYPVGCVLRAVSAELPAAAQDDEEELDPSICPLTEGQMRVLHFLEEGAPRRQGKGKPSPQELAAIKTHTERVNAFCSHLTKQQKNWVAKWRKKFKPEVEQEKPSPAAGKVTRSKSVTNIANAGFNVDGLSDLFEPPNKKADVSSPAVVATKAASKTEASSPNVTGLTKRRQTVHGAKSVALDL